MLFNDDSSTKLEIKEEKTIEKQENNNVPIINKETIVKQNNVISSQNLQLQELNQTKDHLFAVLGHDLRKPAISFRNITEKIRYLIDSKNFTALSKFGKIIEDNAFALTKLTDNLLNWALTQKQAISYRPEVFPIKVVAEEILDLFKMVAADKELQLKSTLPEDLKVFADLNAFNVILRNLVDNAVKYTSKGGSIELSAKSEKDHIEIAVKDTGTGISKEQLKNLYILKKNKSKQGTAGEKGTGLGLYLVHELIKLNKGTITVESEEQKGSIFRIGLPLNK